MPVTRLPRRALIPRIVLVLDALLLALGVGGQVVEGAIGIGFLFPVLIVLMVVGLALVGRLIVRREPGNAVGWILMTSSLGMAAATASYSWASLSHDRFADQLPGTVFAAWVNTWIGIPSLVTLVIFVALLFPDGHLPSPRWRWVAIAAAIGISATTIGSALVAGPLDPIGVANPIGVDPGQPIRDILGMVDTVSGVVVFAAAALAVVVRYQHGSAIERLQFRWFGFPAVVAIVAMGLSAFITVGPIGDVAWIVGLVAMAAVPAAIGIAILRYRLYEIDLILNRTAVYTAVTAILVTAFVAANVVLQYLVESLTGQRSELLAGALGVSAGLLFVPTRSRIRPLIDRFLPARAVVALLFTDIVGSTETIVEIGDERWRGLLGQYLATVRQELARHGGHEVNTAGDAFFATFHRPLDALQAAWAIRAAVQRLGLLTRTGLHLGEVEMRGEQVSGLAVHTAARVMAAAADGEVLVSDAMRDAIASERVALLDRGRHELKGVPGDWQLFAVEVASG